MSVLVLTSTTSHKREPLLTTLEIFTRLGLCDIDLNLHHLLEVGETVDDILRVVNENGLRIWVISGGWCDFFHSPPRIDTTFQSIERQVQICRQLGVNHLRLFFGRLKYDEYSPGNRDVVCANLKILSQLHPDMMFMFENHDGVSLFPEVCREILEQVNRPNIRLNFDPINFERAGVDHMAALTLLEPFVCHVHLKGLERNEFCEFGCGNIDLTPALRTLLKSGYAGRFTVEYEGKFDGTLRLYQSVRHAEALLRDLRGAN